MSPQNNDLDQFDEFDDLHDEDETEHLDAEPPGGLMARIKDAYSNPALKVGTIIVGGIAVVAVAFAILDSNKTVDTNEIGQASNIAGAPGGNVTPETQRVIDESNQAAIEQAANTGGSAIPTPGGTIQKAQEENPLTAFQPEQTTAAIQAPVEDQAALQQQQQQQTEQRNAAIGTMSSAMQDQMKSLLTAWNAGVPNVIEFKQETAQTSTASYNGAPASAGGNYDTVNGTGNASFSAPPVTATPAVKVIQPAGQIKYGTLITEANSDIEGTPILAEVQNGPLRKARLIGQFEVRQDFLVLRFTRVVFKGKEYQSDILALDPDTTLAGLATEVDQRYFSRVVLPAAARFVQGLGQAVADSGTSTTIVGDTVVQTRDRLNTREAALAGLGDAAQSVGNFMDQQASQIKPLVRVASNTQIGLFFVQSVTEDQSQNNTSKTGAANAGIYSQSPNQPLSGAIQ